MNNLTMLTADDVHLFNEGTHYRLYDKLGSRMVDRDGARGAHFAVWAPNAREVALIGNFNGWNSDSHPLKVREQSGIWEIFVPGLEQGEVYKYRIVSHSGYRVDKADPFAFTHETPPSTASMIWDLEYEWGDQEWMSARSERNGLDRPMSVYEVHLGSWRRNRAEGGRPLSYRELAEQLVPYVKQTGFTHVEFLPVMEHPFFGSWGYQITGYFAPTSRYGRPQDLMWLIDQFHRNGIGVILDWVPSHFPNDEHGLGYFDGTHLYEHADPRQGIHRDWNSLVFNYGRKEVRSFLLSNALFWLDRYHADGLRVDAVASMLYLDYSRKSGEWVANDYGGNENIEAIDFLRTFNTDVFKHHSDVQTIAEESTAWPMVSRPTYVGGLGFGLKWDMGWMHDTLQYMSQDPILRKYHHDRLTFRGVYAYTENFALPLSHDEVVHGKGSLLGKMPGDDWQKFANLRLLLGYMYAQPGKKLLFMGGEFGQWKEWNHDDSLDWDLLQFETHQGLHRWVHDLNQVYASEPALFEGDCEQWGFEWVDCHDADNSVLSFLRKSRENRHTALVVCNFTPVPRYNYILGAPLKGFWREVLNSDGRDYGGSGQGNIGGIETVPVSAHGRFQALTLTLPPLGMLCFRWEGERR